MSRIPIGQMNGWWGMLLRFMLATYPIILSWGVWVTTSTVLNNEFRGRGDRFTGTPGCSSVADLKDWHHDDVHAIVNSLRAEFQRELDLR